MGIGLKARIDRDKAMEPCAAAAGSHCGLVCHGDGEERATNRESEVEEEGRNNLIVLAPSSTPKEWKKEKDNETKVHNSL